MHDVQMTERPRLEMRWVPVTDDQGITRPQAVWIEADTAATTAPAAQVHHAA